MQKLVTFDFHNTLAICDPWFYLEIRDLPVDVLNHIDPALLQNHHPDDVITRYRTLREAVMESGKEIDAVDGVGRIADELGIRVDANQIAQAVRAVMSEAMNHVEPVHGAIDAVRQISVQGIPVGVISSAVYHPFLEWTLDSFGLDDKLAFIVTSASSGHYKSNPEIYRYAMDIVGADPASSIHIGDSPKWDVWAAKEAGMSAIWFSNGVTHTFVDRDDETEPDFIAHSMTEVAPWALDHIGAITP